MNELYYNPAKFYDAVSRLIRHLEDFPPAEKTVDVERVKQELILFRGKLEPLMPISDSAALTPGQEEKLVSIRERLAEVLEPLFQGYTRSSGDMPPLPPAARYGKPSGPMEPLPPDLDIYKCPECDSQFKGLRRVKGERCIKCHEPLFKDPNFL